MRAQEIDVQHILSERGVLARRDHPELSGTLDRLLRRGVLTAVLPGVYAPPDQASSFGTRVLAAMAFAPDVILVEHAAAKASYWPELKVTEVTCAMSAKRVSPAGFHFTRRELPDELVVQRGQLRLTAPELTALDLCETLGGEPIDQALRTRTTTLKHLHRAMDLTPARPGNLARRRLLLDSRDEPWSEAERLFHRMLRSAGITGWKSNLGVRPGDLTYFIDVAFRRLRLAIEIDGRLHETDKNIFEGDRWRQNALVQDGWMVLRFTWKMLVEHPEYVIDQVRTGVACCSR